MINAERVSKCRLFLEEIAIEFYRRGWVVFKDGKYEAV
jgi:hypothetical protein